MSTTKEEGIRKRALAASKKKQQQQQNGTTTTTSYDNNNKSFKKKQKTSIIKNIYSYLQKKKNRRKLIIGLTITCILLLLALWPAAPPIEDEAGGDGDEQKQQQQKETQSKVENKDDNNVANKKDIDKDTDINPSIFVNENDGYIVLDELYHDKNAFTQGLTYSSKLNKLSEGTGLYGGKSEIRFLSITDGTTLSLLENENKEDKLDDNKNSKHSNIIKLDDEYFGEGITYYTNKTHTNKDDDNDNDQYIVQLTWQEQTGFIYHDRTTTSNNSNNDNSNSSLELIHTFKYETSNNQGWGITFNPNKNEFIVSDGSSYLFFWDATTLEEKYRLQIHIVRYKKQEDDNDNDDDEFYYTPINYINELEYVLLGEEEFVLANVYGQNLIIKIDLMTGYVTHIYNMETICKQNIIGKNSNGQEEYGRREDVFNGISISDKTNIYYVTGKLWSKMYRIQLLV